MTNVINGKNIFNSPLFFSKAFQQTNKKEFKNDWQMLSTNDFKKTHFQKDKQISITNYMIITFDNKGVRFMTKILLLLKQNKYEHVRKY